MASPVFESERAQASFDKDSMQALIEPLYLRIHPSRIAYLKQLIISHPQLVASPKRYSMSRKELIEEEIQANIVVKSLLEREAFDAEETEYLLSSRTEKAGIALHYYVFLSSLQLLSSPAQFSFYGPYAQRLQMIGAYSQTEAGHGSIVQDIETTAVFDIETQEFVFNSPTPSSVKWWAGALGLLATHAIVFAKLYVGSQHYGLHCFLIPVRDPSTMQSFPGVEVGDIGSKFGSNALDNGFMKLSNYRVHKSCMLERFARLSTTGEIEITEADPKKLLYSSMLNLRVRIGANMWQMLPIALTIAIRYACVRKQFYTVPDSPTTERTLLDYQMQQHKLLPYLAYCYAMSFASKAILAKYQAFTEAAAAGDSRHIGEMHALSTAWKAFSTWNAVKGIEICRLACGGHGFSSFSGLGWLYVQCLPSCTYEGDNTLLCQQTAAVLAKSFEAKSQGKSLAGDFSFFEPIEDLGDASAPMFYSNCFKAMLHILSSRFSEKRKLSPSMTQIDAVNLARVYCAYFVHESFQSGLKEVSPTLRESLLNLKNLYALSELNETLTPLLQERLLSSSTAEQMRGEFNSLLKQTRRDALSLVEAFGIEDHVLCSAIGNSRGEPYEDLLRWAKDFNPVQGVNSAVMKHLKPLAKL